MINVQSYHHSLSKEQFKSGNKIPTLLTLYVHGIKVHQEHHTAELELNELWKFSFSLFHERQCRLANFFKELLSIAIPGISHLSLFVAKAFKTEQRVNGFKLRL